jgi:cytochrome c553
MTTARTALLVAATLLAFALSWSRALAADDEFAPLQATLQACFACHGDKGAAPLPQNPILAGQEYYYLYVQLKDFQSGLRKSDVMGPVAQALKSDDMKLLARYFSLQTWPATSHASDPAKLPVARSAIDSGACISCHLGDFRGNSRVPRLAGQTTEYLLHTMLDFKSTARNNAPAMGALLATFDENDLASLADYLASLTVYQSGQTGEIQ